MKNLLLIFALLCVSCFGATGNFGVDAASGGGVHAGNYMGKNLLVNGNFNFWSRTYASLGTNAASNVAATAAQCYTADMWYVRSSGADCNATGLAAMSGVANSALTAGATYCLGMEGKTSCANVTVGQRMRSLFAAETVATQATCLSFWAYNITGGTLAPVVKTYYPSTTDNWTSTNNNQETPAVTCVAGTPATQSAWTEWTCNIAASSNYTAGFSVEVNFGALSSGAAYVYISQVQLEVGNSPTVFEVLPTGLELQRVQEYSCKSYQMNTAIAAGTYMGSATFIAYNGTYCFGLVQFPVKMWKTPTVTIYGEGGNSATLSGAYSNADLASKGTANAGGISDAGFNFVSDSSNQLSAAGLYGFNWNANAEP